MNSLNPTPGPCILITDNPDIATAFNDEKVTEAAGKGTASVAYLISRIRDTYPQSSLFLSNQNTGFLSLDVECMANSSPRATITAFETSEFFELNILRSAIANLLEKKNSVTELRPIIGPTRIFYIAFGSGDELNYWSSFSGYRLIGAESFDNFDEARRITLEFAAGFSLSDFSTDAISTFANPALIREGYIAVFDKFNKRGSGGEDFAPISVYAAANPNIKARRDYRNKNLPFYLASIENVIDKALQVIFDTDNIFIINYKEPYPLIQRIILENTVPITLEVELSNILNLSELPRAGSLELQKFRVFNKILENIASIFNFNLTPGIKSPSKQIRTLQEIISTDDLNYTLESLKTLGFSLNTDIEGGVSKVEIDRILKSFQDGYNKLLGTDSYSYIRESDLSVLAAADEALIKQFGKSFFDRRKPLVIFGPKELISNYFYGLSYKTNLTSDFNESSEQVKKVNQKNFETVFNLYNSQNLNDNTLIKLLEGQEDLKQKFNNVIKNNNYPIFKHNMQNSNVLSLKISDNRAYLLLLSQAYSVLSAYASIKTTLLKDPASELESQEAKEIDAAIKRRQFTDVSAIGPRTQQAQQRVDDATQIEVDAIVKKYQEKRKEGFIYRLAAATNKERLDMLLREGRFSPNIDYVITSTFLGRPAPSSEQLDAIKAELFSEQISVERKLELLKSDRGFSEELLQQEAEAYIDSRLEKYGLIRRLEDGYASDPIAFFSDQLDVLDKHLFQVEIETLPFFAISNFSFLLSPCFLFSQRPPFIGDRKTRNPLDSISGGYYITGYHHTIDQNKVVSRFVLFSLQTKDINEDDKLGG